MPQSFFTLFCLNSKAFMLSPCHSEFLFLLVARNLNFVVFDTSKLIFATIKNFSNKCNVGYGFVNMTSPEAAVRLYKAFHKQPWEVYNSRKICQVTYARVQVRQLLPFS